MTQLRVIEHALNATLPSTAPAHMVIFGDLNFRFVFRLCRPLPAGVMRNAANPEPTQGV